MGSWWGDTPNDRKKGVVADILHPQTAKFILTNLALKRVKSAVRIPKALKGAAKKLRDWNPFKKGASSSFVALQKNVSPIQKMHFQSRSHLHLSDTSSATAKKSPSLRHEQSVLLEEFQMALRENLITPSEHAELLDEV